MCYHVRFRIRSILSLCECAYLDVANAKLTRGLSLQSDFGGSRGAVRPTVRAAVRAVRDDRRASLFGSALASRLGRRRRCQRERSASGRFLME